MNDYELMHYGVKGMKWGVRKARPDLYAQRSAAKAQYKSAKKAYNRAFNKADARSLAAFSPIKKHRENNDKRWNDAYDKGQAMNKAKAAYKAAKQAVKADSKARKAAEKALAKANQIKIKDLQAEYGKLEDQMTYGKNANAAANARIQQQMNDIDRQLNALRNKR